MATKTTKSKAKLPAAYERVLEELRDRIASLQAAIDAIELLRGTPGFTGASTLPPAPPVDESWGLAISEDTLVETGPPPDPDNPDSGQARYV